MTFAVRSIGTQNWRVVLSGSINSSEGSWGNYTLRQLIPASVFSSGGSGLRLTLTGISGYACSLSSAYIGYSAGGSNPLELTGSPVQLTYSGGSTIAITNGNPILLDPVTIQMDGTSSLVFSAFSTQNYMSFGSEAGYTAGYVSGDKASQTGSVGISSSTYPNRRYLISKIEMK